MPTTGFPACPPRPAADATLGEATLFVPVDDAFEKLAEDLELGSPAELLKDTVGVSVGGKGRWAGWGGAGGSGLVVGWYGGRCGRASAQTLG